jgi:hypothetical protein
VPAHTARLQRLAPARHAHGNAWRLSPIVEALQALRGGPLTGAVTRLAALVDLPCVDHPRPRRHDLGLTPSVSARGERRRQGSLPKTGNPQARLGTRDRPLSARGTHPQQVVVAMACELIACLWALAQHVPSPPSDGGRLVVESSVPQGFQVKCPSPAEEAQPRGGVTLVRVQRCNILIPRARQAPDGDQSGGRPPTDIRRITRRCFLAPPLPRPDGDHTSCRPQKVATNS